ncbi:MAG: bifunctional nuclease family protein [Chloroflexota bacterium]
MVEMTIDSIRISMVNYQRVVILKEKNAERYLPIWIGPAEAEAIAVKLQGMSVPRPLTHDLLCSVIETLGAKVGSIIVCDLKSDTFYAKIIMSVDGSQLEIDARPSDAMALAVRLGVPIYAEESVLDRASILLDKETGKPIGEEEVTEPPPAKEKEREKRKKPSEDEMKKSAFYDFINTLDLEDFDKRKS